MAATLHATLKKTLSYNVTTTINGRVTRSWFCLQKIINRNYLLLVGSWFFAKPTTNVQPNWRSYKKCHANDVGVRGRVVKVVNFKPLVLHRCGFEYRQKLWIFSCEEAIQLVYGTSVVLLRPVSVRAWNNARKGTWRLAPPVKLERRHMTYTVSMWRQTQSNKKKRIQQSCLMGIIRGVPDRGISENVPVSWTRPTSRAVLNSATF
jgi:hypothetical protein